MFPALPTSLLRPVTMKLTLKLRGSNATIPNYPGLGLPLRFDYDHEDRCYPIGTHQDFPNSKSDLLPIRELAMMSIMDRLTDKPDWHTKVFDETIVSKWREEALSVPDEEFVNISWNAKGWAYTNYGNNLPATYKKFAGIMNRNTFDCVSCFFTILYRANKSQCIQELRSKAVYFKKSEIIPTLDACASVAKSDTLVGFGLQDALGKTFAKLMADQSKSPDWHPNSGDMVQDVVHPSLYPLVYGRTIVFKQEVVQVSDAIDKWAGKGDVTPKPDIGVRYSELPDRYWSNTYQWLPANLAFQEDGRVKFTSYINNLHPVKYPGIYRTIERLVETALPMWDQCLQANPLDHTAGRFQSRFPDPTDPK